MLASLDHWGRQRGNRVAPPDIAETLIDGRIANATVAALLDAPADSTAPDDLGLTLVHAVAESGTRENIAVIVRNGVSINTRNAASETPLPVVGRGRNAATAEALIMAGANLEGRSLFGATPLHIVAAFASRDEGGLGRAAPLNGLGLVKEQASGRFCDGTATSAASSDG